MHMSHICNVYSPKYVLYFNTRYLIFSLVFFKKKKMIPCRRQKNIFFYDIPAYIALSCVQKHLNCLNFS